MESIRQLTMDGTIMVLEMTQEKFTPCHTHDFFEIAYIVSGSAHHDIGGQKTLLQPGDYFIVDYDTHHEYVSEEGITIINCLFRPELVDKTLAGVKNFNELSQRYFFRITGQRINGPTANQVFHDDTTAGALFHQMLTEYQQQKDGYIEMLRCLLCQMMIQTIRQVGSLRKESELTRLILSEIEKHFRNPLTLELLCQQLHYSLSYASSKFKEDTGVTFTHMLQNRRIEESCRLLIETKQSIAQIAEQVGYSNVKFFNQIFKRVTKTTPREYRKLNTHPASRFTFIS